MAEKNRSKKGTDIEVTISIKKQNSFSSNHLYKKTKETASTANGRVKLLLPRPSACPSPIPYPYREQLVGSFCNPKFYTSE